MPIKLHECVCLFLCVMSMCVQCGSPSVGAWKAHPFSRSIHHANEPHTQLSMILTHNPTLISPSSHSPVLSTFTPSFLSISGLCKSFHFLTFSCLCPILYLLVFLSILYLAEQGPNLHSLWPLWERERGKFLWPSWWYWRLNPHLSHHLSLPQMLNTSQIGNRRRKQYCCQLSLSVCLPLHMIMLFQAEMFSHISQKIDQSHIFSILLCISCVFKEHGAPWKWPHYSNHIQKIQFITKNSHLNIAHINTRYKSVKAGIVSQAHMFTLTCKTGRFTSQI